MEELLMLIGLGILVYLFFNNTWLAIGIVVIIIIGIIVWFKITENEDFSGTTSQVTEGYSSILENVNEILVEIYDFIDNTTDEWWIQCKGYLVKSELDVYLRQYCNVQPVQPHDYYCYQFVSDYIILDEDRFVTKVKAFKYLDSYNNPQVVYVENTNYECNVYKMARDYIEIRELHN